MLAETVNQWKKEWENQGVLKGRQEGRQEGRKEGRKEGRQEGRYEGRREEAAKLFLLLLDAKFGDVGHDLQEKIRQASPEEIERWTRQVFQAETPEALLNG